MPYKNIEDSRANRRLGRSRRGLERLRSLGLEPRDVNDPRSEVECLDCGKISKRSTAIMFKHEPWCWRSQDHPIKFWDRRKLA